MRIALRITSVIALTLACACSDGSSDSNALPFTALSDCTESVAREFEQPVLEVPSAVRAEALRRVSAWSTEKCYLPCNFEMCGAITEYSDERVTVYVRYLPEPHEEGVYTIGPEAQIKLSLPSYAIAEETIWHSGCRWRSPDCEWLHNHELLAAQQGRADDEPRRPTGRSRRVRMTMDKNAVLVELSESDRTDFGRVAFEDQSPPQRVFSAIWSLESQVNNGGFEQYFTSPDGDMANFAPQALREIGAARCAAIVERAVRLVSPSPLPESQENREDLIAELPGEVLDQLDALDTEFFAYPDDLTELLFDYVQQQPETFRSVAADGNV